MLIKKPIWSSKTKLIYKKYKTYVFYVDPKANKFQIKQFFEKTFGIKANKIRTSRYKPVLQKISYLRRQPGKSYTKLLKKAFIESASNQKEIDLFDNEIKRLK